MKYQDLDKEVKRLANRDKKDYMYVKNLAEKAEVFAARQELNTVDTIVKTLRVGYSS